MLVRDEKENKSPFGPAMVWAAAVITLAAFVIGDFALINGGRAYADAGAEATAEELDVTPITTGDSLQPLRFQKDISVRDALRVLSAKYQRNIVPTANVDGAVTVTTLYDVTFEQALDAVLGYGFKWEQDGNFIKVYTAEEYKKIKEDPMRMVQEVFTLYYVNSTEMKKLIAPALSGNAIVAASSAPMQDTEAGNGGDSLAMLDTLVVYDYPENIEKIAAMIDQVDQRPPAILIEVTILEAELKDITEFGINLSTVGCVAFACGATEGLATSGFVPDVTSGLSAAFSIDDVTGFIKALETITDTTVLANPKIMALNKQAGHILIGSEEGYLTVTQVSADGAVQQVEFLESGTTLKFRPFVCKNGYIRMEISPEQSTGAVEEKGDFVLPRKDTTEVSTNIMVKDGRTIVIGGLFKEEITQDHSQVPVLGDLPLVGPAFQSVKDTVVRKELIIMITPRLIEDPEELADSQEVRDVEIITEGAKESLNIINRTKIFEERLELAAGYYEDGYYEAALADIDAILELRPNYPDAARLRDKILAKMLETK